MGAWTGRCFLESALWRIGDCISSALSPGSLTFGLVGAGCSGMWSKQSKEEQSSGEPKISKHKVGSGGSTRTGTPVDRVLGPWRTHPVGKE